MDHVFEPDRDAIRGKRAIALLWAAGAALSLLVLWGGTLAKIAHDAEALREQAASLPARASMRSSCGERSRKSIRSR